MQSHSRSRGTAAAEICARVHAVAYCTPSRARRRLRPARRVERRQYCDLTRKINAGDDNALRWIDYRQRGVEFAHRMQVEPGYDGSDADWEALRGMRAALVAAGKRVYDERL